MDLVNNLALAIGGSFGGWVLGQICSKISTMFSKTIMQYSPLSLYRRYRKEKRVSELVEKAAPEDLE